jgi:rod shape-determining protein MreB
MTIMPASIRHEGMRRRDSFRRDIAIDLGTGNTVVHIRGRGIALFEPSVVAVDRRSGEVCAVGTDAHRMIGRTAASLEVVRPLKEGVISDLDATIHMLRHFIRKAHHSCLGVRRIVVGVPAGVTEIERRAAEEVCLAVGARQAFVIDEPLAAAIGAGLPVAEPTGSMILDIGSGISEVAVIALGGIVASESVRVGGDALDDAIVAHVKRMHRVAIGRPTAERVKREIGAAHPSAEERVAEVRGWDVAAGAPKTVVLTGEELRRVIEEPLSKIVAAVHRTLARTPPELACDVMSRGIVLAGGGSLLRGLDTRLRAELRLPVERAASALECVAAGAAMSLVRPAPARRRHPHPVARPEVAARGASA